MKPSPVFARVVRVNRGDLVYTEGLYPEKPGTGEEQVLSVFDQLQQILKETGGHMKHLAKATYYVSDEDASKQLNAIRPRFYDPQRPPAASKAVVNDVGMKDRSITIDMIGVVDRSPTTNTIKP
jgi:enamine deaminase RidA (YjgF/YER057c/UK114 family)